MPNPDPYKVLRAADEFLKSNNKDKRCQSRLDKKCGNNPRRQRLMVMQSQYYGRKKSAAGILVDAAVAWGFDANVFSDYILYPTEKHSDKLVVELHRLTQRADLESCRPRQQTPPAEPAVPADAGNGEGYTVAALRDMTGLANTALNKYAKLANVPTPSRGKRSHRYTAGETRAILQAIITRSSEADLVNRCRDALEKSLINPAKIA